VNERKAWSLIGMALGGALGWIAHLIFGKRIGDDDRPPIIVRGGSITFEHDRGWAEHGGNWRPDHDTGKPVKELVAYIRPYGTKEECTGRELRGTRLDFEYASTFRILIAGREPMVAPRGLLTRDSSYKRVGYAKGPKALGTLRAWPSGRTDTVAETEEVCVCFQYDSR
jgi:hypothetical protein